MKKIIFGICAVVLSFSIVSCENALDTNNYTQASSDNFPSRKADVVSLLAGLYSTLDYIQTNPLQFPFYMDDIMSDDCNSAGGTGDNEVRALSHFTRFSKTMFDDTWKLCYRGIYRANNIIETIDNFDWEGDYTTREQYLGEAYFLRALFYFWATQLWGDIPMPLSTAVPNPCPEVSAENEIFPQIFSDLVSAGYLMDESRVYPASKDGHATVWAAEALLARAYMWYQGFYKKAGELANASLADIPLNEQEGVEFSKLTKNDVIEALEDVINNSNHKLVGDFRNLWQYTNFLTAPDYSYLHDEDGNLLKGVDGQDLGWAGNNNEEELFSIQFMNASSWNSTEYKMGYANETSLFCGLRCDSDFDGYTNGGLTTFPFGQGWGQGVASGNFWKDWSEKESEEGEEDIRKTASILDCVAELEHYAFVTTGCEDAGYSIKKLLPVTCMKKENGDPVDWGTTSTWWAQLSEYGGSSNGQDMQGAHYNNIILIRLADVYLMHTELTGNPQYMNLVRARAGLSPIAYSWKAIQDERRYELAFEGLRYQDLRRWSGTDATADALVCEKLDGQAGQTIYVKGVVSQTLSHHMNTASWSGRYVETNGFLPKPYTQVTLASGAMTQNKGWDTPTAEYTTMF